MTLISTPKLAAAAAAATLLLGSAAAVASSGGSSHAAATSGGKVRVWVAKPGKVRSPILLTGAIGDHGTATTETKSGTPSKNGNYVHLHLQNGTFLVNATRFNQKLNSVAPHVDKTTCTAWLTGAGNVTVSNGTGAYAGISGTVRISTSFAGLFPRHTSGPKKGTCELGNSVQPVAQFLAPITGVGSVSFG